MGCTALQVPPSQLSRLLERGQVHVSPSGVAFVSRECRRGLLPDMLEEILNTRIMVRGDKAGGRGGSGGMVPARLSMT